MKKLSDYKGEDAIILWDDLLEPLIEIIKNPEVKTLARSGKSRIELVRGLIRLQKKEITEILLRIDPTPIDGLNIITRLIDLFTEISENKELVSFFGYAAQAKTDRESTDSATENIGESEN